MIFRRSVGDEQASLRMCGNEIERDTIKRARQMLDADVPDAAWEIIDPLIESGNAEAIFFGSSFSRGGESAEDFEQRHLEMLSESAKKGYPPALYAMGMYLDTGEHGKHDKTAAALLFKQAADAGHAHSKWIYGIDLLYGLGCFQKDEKRGVQLICEAAEAGFQGALETLAKFHEKGQFGFAFDLVAAQSLRERAVADDVIGY